MQQPRCHCLRMQLQEGKLGVNNDGEVGVKDININIWVAEWGLELLLQGRS